MGIKRLMNKRTRKDPKKEKYWLVGFALNGIGAVLVGSQFLMLFDWGGYGRLGAVVAVLIPYLAILAVAFNGTKKSNSKKSRRKCTEMLYSMIGGPVFLVILAYVFSEHSA